MWVALGFEKRLKVKTNGKKTRVWVLILSLG
jgi:hypothetical protein